MPTEGIPVSLGRGGCQPGAVVGAIGGAAVGGVAGSKSNIGCRY